MQKTVDFLTKILKVGINKDLKIQYLRQIKHNTVFTFKLVFLGILFILLQIVNYKPMIEEMRFAHQRITTVKLIFLRLIEAMPVKWRIRSPVSLREPRTYRKAQLVRDLRSMLLRRATRGMVESGGWLYIWLKRERSSGEA